MKIFRALGIALILIGGVLLVLGIMSTQKTGEKIVEGVTGHYTSTTVWYIVGGIVLIVGGFGLRRIK
jgi:uncharacterized membrane protein YidH (DUF202 family)